MSCALITGAGRGIGRAIAQQLAAQGHDVAINYAGNQQAAEQTVALCLEAAATAGHPAVRARAFRADVADAAACEQLYAEVSEAFGAPTILVNNAGITRDNLMLRMPVEDFDAVIATNLRSAFVLTKLASRAMVKARGGRIINISSVVGITGNAGQANYAASKAGVIGLTKSAARELAGRGVTVNAVAPGFISTDMTAVLDDKTRESLQTSIPLKRLGEPEDIARVVAFLASEAAAYVTGQVIAVDGGMTI
ncbi:MAG: 3-oxoacyl-[acyl-carrier-protein] reductase [Coriobacteriales bacterium]|jgi:3-oxoacyl-[acyl-carrier protein] reductase|nr:3-oxoacyl-[acyl-carrier-protein] reductase [Coriobacteriales bacterium]